MGNWNILLQQRLKKHVPLGVYIEAKMTKAEGKYFEFDDEDQINPDFLETFSFDSPNQYIATETDEFSAVCPFSGLPDLAYVKIEYYPTGGKCIELKSLKYYFVSFRNVGIYQEGATKRIYLDLKNVLATEKVKVTTIYNTRGGFDTTCIEGKLDQYFWYESQGILVNFVTSFLLEKKKMKNSVKKNDRIARGAGLGLTFGIIFGAATDNIGLGIALGLALGAGIGSTQQNKAKSKEKE